MESCLVSEGWVPKEAFDVGENGFIDEFFGKLLFRGFFQETLLEVKIVNKEFLDLFGTSDDNSGPEADDDSDCGPSFFFFQVSDFEGVRGGIQESIITNNLKSEFVVVKKQINKLGLPMVVSHVISELNKMITHSLGVFVQIMILFPLLIGNL